MQKSNLRNCKNGHQFYKSSDCQTCPICEKEKKPVDGFLSQLSLPARNSLISNGINSVQDLSNYAEKDVLGFHGMGPSSIPILRKALDEKGLSYKK